jgi:integrase
MPKTALQFKSLIDGEPKPGRYHVGNGAYLQVAKGGSKAWIFKYRFNGKLRYMGLGAFKTWGLAGVRARALELRQDISKGIDPIAARKTERQKAQVAEAAGITFKECAERYIAGHKKKWTNALHRKQWPQTLEKFVYPTIGKLPVADIDTTLVLKVLDPIWSEKPETASRVRGRIELVLGWAKVRGYRQGDNPAAWKGHLREALPSRTDVAAIEHHPALPFTEIGEFMVALRKIDGVAARALEFTILTASRSGETLLCSRSEIDLESRTWTVPSERMKAGKEHRVPLCDRAIEIVKDLPTEDAYLFPGTRKGKPLNGKAMRDVLKRLRADVTVHGFRSTFSDWASEVSDYPDEMAELALAHAVGTKVERAYRRGSRLQKRHEMMAGWAAYCAAESVKRDVVIPLPAARVA